MCQLLIIVGKSSFDAFVRIMLYKNDFCVVDSFNERIYLFRFIKIYVGGLILIAAAIPHHQIITEWSGSYDECSSSWYLNQHQCYEHNTLMCCTELAQQSQMPIIYNIVTSYLSINFLTWFVISNSNNLRIATHNI